MKKYPLSGVVVSLNTPFDHRGHIDFGSLERSIEMHLQEGASGFLAPAQAGEVTVLSLTERIDLIRCVQQNLNNRAVFIAGATAEEPKQCRTVAEAALKAGCEAVLVEVPQRLRSNRHKTLSFCRSVAGVGMPTLAIQDLDWAGFGMNVSWIVELFETIDSFRLLKVEVCPAGPKYSQVIAATQGQLTVAGGWAADQMIEALDRGVDIYMPTAMTRLYSEVVLTHREGNRQRALEIFYKILPVLAFTRQHIDISIQFYKRLFVHRGIFSTTGTRKRVLPYDDYHEKYGKEVIGYLDKVEAEIFPTFQLKRTDSARA